MSFKIWALPLVIVALTAGCGGAQPATSRAEPSLVFSCAPGGQPPPTKLIVPQKGGISGQWLVALAGDPSQLRSTAANLTRRYGGQVVVEWDGLNAFLMALDDSKAQALSEDAAVCWVEQDQIISVG